VVRPFYEIRTPLELLEGKPLYDETFSNNNFGGNFKKAWLPRGRLVAQCGYTPNEDYNIKTKMLSYFVLEMQERLKPYNVLKMNDEAIMLDVIIEDLRSSGYDLKVHTRMEL